jgi:integrase
MSLAYRLGMENGKADSNPARLVRLRVENNARLRFLSREEYKKLLDIFKRDNPDQIPAFVVSVYTGMRWGEQYSLTWAQVDLKRKVVRLTTTKNGSARNVPLNSVTRDALLGQQTIVPHEAEDTVFPRPGPSSDCRWWFAPALMEAEIADYTWHNNRHTLRASLPGGHGISLRETRDRIVVVARYNKDALDMSTLCPMRQVSCCLYALAVFPKMTCHICSSFFWIVRPWQKSQFRGSLHGAVPRLCLRSLPYFVISL